MNRNIRLDDNTNFNPRTGEFISGGNGGAPPPPVPNPKFSGWWIIGGLFFLFLIYKGISAWGGKQADPPLMAQQNPPSQQTTPPPVNTPPSNPYGPGNGRLTVYKTCNNCPDLLVAIDGEDMGTLAQTFDESSPPSCGGYGTVFKDIPYGQHNLTAKDSYGNTWNLPINVPEGQCTIEKLFLNADVKPNPYGVGNGQITIYHHCSTCANVQVSVDGSYAGNLNSYYYDNDNPTCGTSSQGAIIQIVSAGNHYIAAKDGNGDTWYGNVTVNEGVCQNYVLQNFTQAAPTVNYQNNNTQYQTETNNSQNTTNADNTYYQNNNTNTNRNQNNSSAGQYYYQPPQNNNRTVQEPQYQNNRQPVYRQPNRQPVYRQVYRQNSYQHR